MGLNVCGNVIYMQICCNNVRRLIRIEKRIRNLSSEVFERGDSYRMSVSLPAKFFEFICCRRVMSCFAGGSERRRKQAKLGENGDKWQACKFKAKANGVDGRPRFVMNERNDESFSSQEGKS